MVCLIQYKIFVDNFREFCDIIVPQKDKVRQFYNQNRVGELTLRDLLIRVLSSYVLMEERDGNAIIISNLMDVLKKMGLDLVSCILLIVAKIK
jgi:hypothetical protein